MFDIYPACCFNNNSQQLEFKVEFKQWACKCKNHINNRTFRGKNMILEVKQLWQVNKSDN